MNKQAFAIGIEPGNERAVDDLSGKERPLKRHHHKVAPRFVSRIAHANNRATTFSVEGRGRADHEIAVSLPSQDVAGIRGFESNGARFAIYSAHVENISIAQVERD